MASVAAPSSGRSGGVGRRTMSSTHVTGASPFATTSCTLCSDCPRFEAQAGSRSHCRNCMCALRCAPSPSLPIPAARTNADARCFVLRHRFHRSSGAAVRVTRALSSSASFHGLPRHSAVPDMATASAVKKLSAGSVLPRVASLSPSVRWPCKRFRAPYQRVDVMVTLSDVIMDAVPRSALRER